MTEPKTHTLDVPGAVLHYDVRSDEASTQPVLLIIGSPMGAAGFGTLAGHFTDRTVVTYDPRGADRSRRTDGAAETTPEEHADDLHRLILALDAGPVDIFASSGGAVNALALVARHPEQVRTLVAHEPPASRNCRTARRCWPHARTSARPIIAAASARRWRSSSRWLATRARCRPVTLTSPARIPPPSGCPPRTTAPATTRSSGRTSSPAMPTGTISTRSAPRRPASLSGSERNPARG